MKIRYLILVIFLLLVSCTKESMTICKEKTPFKIYWQETTLSGTVKNWHYEDNASFYIKFETAENHKESGLTYLELYNKSSKTDFHIAKGFNYYADALIDNVMIYDRALGATEIKFMYYNQNEADNELTWDTAESYTEVPYKRFKGNIQFGK